MSSSDETYLESFIENISTLPHEVRRNLELMKDLDKSCSAIVEQLQNAEEEYIRRAEEKVLNIPLSPELQQQGSDGGTQSVEGEPLNSSVVSSDHPGGEQAEIDASGGTPAVRTMMVVPTTEELRAFVEDPNELVQIARLRRDACQQPEEKAAIAEQTYSIIDAAVQRLDTDLEKFEKLLKGTGEFETAGGAKPNDLAAIQVMPSSADWILAKVISHDPETGMYKLSDEDVESSKIFHLPESQVVVLGGVERLARGDIIYAVYPDTTSFYQATVVQAPRKVSGGGSFVMVNFKDDGDEHGVTHDKAVLMKHVMRVPYGVIT